MKPGDLLLQEEYKITAWKVIKTKYGEKLQVTLYETGLLILPDRMLKALGEGGLGENIKPPEGATLKFLGRDPQKYNACMYDLYIKNEERAEEEEDDMEFLQDAQKW